METIRPLVSKDGTVSANRAGRSLVIADFADNISRIRQVLARIDSDNNTTTVVALTNAGAREIAASLQALMAGSSEGAQPECDHRRRRRLEQHCDPRRQQHGEQAGRHGAGAGQARRGRHGSAHLLARACRFREARSRVAAAAGAGGHYQRQHDGSLRLARLDAGGSGGPAAPVAPPPTPAAATQGAGIATRGPAVVTRYEGTNALIVAANPDVQRQVGEVIRQLDTRRPQVLVEAIIVEIGNDAASVWASSSCSAAPRPALRQPIIPTPSQNILTVAGAIAATKLNQTTTTVINPNGSTTTTTATENIPISPTSCNRVRSTPCRMRPGASAASPPSLARAAFSARSSARSSRTRRATSSRTPSITTLDNQKAHMLVGQRSRSRRARRSATISTISSAPCSARMSASSST